MRVVIDTSTIISAIVAPGGKSDLTVRRCLRDHVLLVSSQTMEELKRVAESPKFSRPRRTGSANELIRAIESLSVVVKVQANVLACRDVFDNKFLELALDGKADIILSGDADLRALNPFRGIPILSSAEFLNRFG